MAEKAKKKLTVKGLLKALLVVLLILVILSLIIIFSCCPADTCHPIAYHHFGRQGQQEG